MKIQNKLIVIVLSFLMSAAVLAHSNHAPREPITEVQLIEKANSVINQLINQKKLQPSWKQAERAHVIQKDHAQGKFWVVKYVNKAVNDDSVQSLYIALDELGNILSASHTAP